MPKTENLKSAKSANPKWLDTARLFYAESFGALKNRELRSSKDDWSDLTEEEQTFALAHLQYLDLMAQAGTQRLLVQIRDLLEEIADGLAAEREAPAEDATGEEDVDDFDDGSGDNLPGPDFEPQGPFTHPVPRATPIPTVQLEADPDDSEGSDNDSEEEEDASGEEE